jgi:hypothetical protein
MALPFYSEPPEAVVIRIRHEPLIFGVAHASALLAEHLQDKGCKLADALIFQIQN